VGFIIHMCFTNCLKILHENIKLTTTKDNLGRFTHRSRGRITMEQFYNSKNDPFKSTSHYFFDIVVLRIRLYKYLKIKYL